VDDERIWARATVNLPGLRAGEVALVNPRVLYIAEALEAEHLVPLEDAHAPEE
jgi:hypothetical protein